MDVTGNSSIKQAVSEDDISAVRELFREYEAWLGLDLCFQGFEEELASLPGKYAEPDGRLYLARVDGKPTGCAALRRLDNETCEIKRLYLRPSARGLGLGKRLVERLIDDARLIGYRRIRLDTFPPKMAKAVGLYESHGFRAIPPYYDNPHAETLFMELNLGSDQH